MFGSEAGEGLCLTEGKEDSGEEGAEGTSGTGSGRRLTVANLTAKLKQVNPLLNTMRKERF